MNVDNNCECRMKGMICNDYGHGDSRYPAARRTGVDHRGQKISNCMSRTAMRNIGDHSNDILSLFYNARQIVSSLDIPC